MKRLLAFGLALSLGVVAWAQNDPNTNLSPSDAGVLVTNNIGLDQKLGAKVPLDTAFKDEDGRDVKLGDYFHDKPILFVPIFYQCRGTCALITDGVLTALAGIKYEEVGKSFDVVCLSINHTETPAMAKDKRAFYVDCYGRPGTEKGWHMLTGTEKNIRAVTDTLGYRFTFDPKTQRINHPAGVIVLTPKGVVSQYLYGVEYPPVRMRDAIVNAGVEKVGVQVEPVLFGCFQYDPVKKTLTLVVDRTVKVLSIATLIILVTSITVMSIRSNRARSNALEL